MNELLPLRYVSFDEVYKKSKHETGIFLRVHLQDGTSFRMVYYPKANAFSRSIWNRKVTIVNRFSEKRN